MTDVVGAPTSPKRAKKTALVLAERIVESITAGGYDAGEALPPEHEMLDSYGVGRATLREALRFLELQGVVRLKPGPGGGPIVTQPQSRSLANTIALLLHLDHAPLRTIIEAREAIEPAAARQAARRASTEQVQEIADSAQAIARVAEDALKFSAENERFHRLIAEASANHLYAYLVPSLHWIVDGAAAGFHYPLSRRRKACEWHLRIASAIYDRSPQAAELAMREHLLQVQEFMESEHPDLLDVPLPWRHSTDEL